VLRVVLGRVAMRGIQAAVPCLQQEQAHVCSCCVCTHMCNLRHRQPEQIPLTSATNLYQLPPPHTFPPFPSPPPQVP
jgi:hypothetical protein